MAEMTLVEKLDKVNYNPNLGPAEKFLVSLDKANDENFAIKEKYGLVLRPKDWIILTIDPKELEKRLAQAKSLGFVKAYEQNPSFLKQKIEDVTKRMSTLDALGISYIDENGKYLQIVFSKRAFDYITSRAKNNRPLLGEEKEELASDGPSVRKYAERLIEEFNLLNNSEEIRNKVKYLEISQETPANILFQVFRGYADNEEYLLNKIDELIDQYKKELGR